MTTLVDLQAAARVQREAIKDKSYRASPLGLEVARYYRWKKNEWGATAETLRDYEAILSRLATFFADLELKDFEPPVGTERLRECWDHHWGDRSVRTRRKVLSVFRDFFSWAVREGKLNGSPAAAITSPKKRDGSRRLVYTLNEERKIIAAQPRLRDRIALRLLFHTGMRKGALAGIQLKHFDFSRRHVTVTTKGQVIRDVKILDPALWDDIGRYVIERGDPEEFLLYPEKYVYTGAGKPRDLVWEKPEKPMSSSVMHRWWYACLRRAGIVDEGVTSGRKMHWARHTAGQRMLDTTGNLKAVQKLLGHAHLMTTGDIYVDWDEAALILSMQQVLEAEKQDEDE